MTTEQQTTKEDTRKKITCLKCKHSWKTKSKLKWVTCSNCQYKVRND